MSGIVYAWNSQCLFGAWVIPGIACSITIMNSRFKVSCVLRLSILIKGGQAVVDDFSEYQILSVEKALQCALQFFGGRIKRPVLRGKRYSYPGF